MRGILADKNSEGHVGILLQRLLGEPWREIWLSLQLPILTFAELQVTAEASDAELWQACQDNEVLLLTINRNAKGPDSLEATIRRRSTAASLPVFTLANPDRIVQERDYVERAAERFLEYLIDIDAYRGTRRLYLP